MKKVLFTGGGTGGHIMPIIAIARELKKLHSKHVLYYIGPKDKLTSDLLEGEGFKIQPIVCGKIRRYFSILNIVDILFKIPFSFLQSFFLLLFIRPQLVFSKGGTGSLPVTYWARLFRKPVFIHESDVVPGLSNKITSKWAKRIFVSFEKTEYFNKNQTTLVGNPIRKDLLKGTAKDAKNILNLNSKKPVILVLGGSQGSESINEFILLILNKLLEDYELIHVSGSKNYKKASIQSKIVIRDKEMGKYYHLYEFLNEVELKNAYVVSNIIISRAGSGSIFEIAASGKPSILIPLPGAASNHQSKNAYEYQESGATIVIEQDNLSPGFFKEEIHNILSQYKKMEKAALKFAKPDAAENIAKEIISYLDENKKN